MFVDSLASNNKNFTKVWCGSTMISLGFLISDLKNYKYLCENKLNEALEIRMFLRRNTG